MLKKLFGHLRTITKHRHMVMSLCRKAGIGWQGLRHDLSKYSYTELKTGVKFYTGDRSPNSAERAQKGFSEAWMHHKGRNKHHYEYWYDLSKNTGGYAPVPMPVNYLLESFCDRIAACKVYQKDKYTDASPYKYFIEKHDGDAMHPESAALLSRWLLLLADRGEKAALKQIRGEYKAYKKEKKTAEKKLRRNQEN